MPGTILLMDNVLDVLEEWGELLEHDGYHVLKARTLEEAENLLLHRRVHLAILDVRMRDEDDENDISGLLLAKKPEFRLIPKIILTAYPSYDYVRIALAPDDEGYIPASNFIQKGEGPQALRQAIDQVFRHQVRINWELRIDSDPREHLSFPHLAGVLQQGLSNAALVERAGGLEDVFRKLFYDYRQIRIGPLLWRAGRRCCLPVLAQSAQETTDHRLVVCGGRSDLEQELKRLHELAPETVGGIRVVNTAELQHFGAVAYSLPDADLETVQPLCNMFQGGRERSLKPALDHLLKVILAAWHRRGHTVEKAGLMALYRRRAGLEGPEGMPQALVDQRVEALVEAERSSSMVQVQRADGTISFHFRRTAPIVCPDPVAAAYAATELTGEPIVCRISPGRLTAENILVDGRQRAWLTDFAEAGLAPQWWDFVWLEAVLRFDVGEAADLLAWQGFEESLVAPASLEERLQIKDVAGDLRSSIPLIEQIRQQAGSETGSDALPYYAGLLVWAVGAMAQFDPTRIYTQTERGRAAHLLLSAALLARRIGELADQRQRAPGVGGTGRAARAGHGLRLDEDGARVWIGTQLVDDLSPQELDLFRCLNAQAGKVVPRKTLVEVVLKEQYDPKDQYQAGRLNSLLARLRQKIETNPHGPKYIHTMRGQGYRLETGE